MLTAFVFIFFANIYINEGYNTTCLPPSICCKSYHSNQSNQTVCTECVSGYYGQNCSYACRYPNYGKDCQSECLCDEESCNHKKGCEQKTCPNGYSGPSCNSTCQFPSYGADCRLNCSCEWQHCDPITGCSTSVQNETYWTTDLTLNKSNINIMHVSYEDKTLMKDVTVDNAVEDQTHILLDSTNAVSVEEDLTAGTTAEEQATVLHNSTKYEPYFNKSLEKGGLLNCSSVQPYLTRPFRSKTMLISLCILVAAFIVIIAIYLRLNNRPTTFV